jgi:hypothetical protein
MRNIANLDSTMREHLGSQVWIRVVHPELTSQHPERLGKVIRKREIVEEYGVLRRFAIDGHSLILTLIVDGIESKVGVWNAEKDEWFVRSWVIGVSVKPWSGLKESGDIM